MKQEKFIPNHCDESFDSDNSSILGDFDEVVNEEFSEEDSNVLANENDPNDLEDVDNESDEISSIDDASDDESIITDDDTKKNEDSSKVNDNDDDDSDSDSTCSEEASATMQEVFGTKPNPEANRNHPPNFKTDSHMLDLCFHPEKELIAAGSIEGECIIYRYNLEEVKEVSRFLHHTNSCRQICFSEDGVFLYSVSKDKSLAIVDTQNSAIKLHLKDIHESPIYSFLEINKNLGATGDDDGILKLWDFRKPKPIMEFKCGEETVTSLLTCEAEKFLSATVGDGSITGINLRTNRLECQSELSKSEFTCQALVRSESKLAVGTGSGSIQIFNWGQFGFEVDYMSGHPDLIQCMVPITENMLITGCEDGNIRAVHLYDHRFIGIVGQHKDFGVENLAVSCDGNTLASCSMDENIQFWNIEYLYKRKVNAKKKSHKKLSAALNLESSKKPNRRDFFKDIPHKMESDDDEGGPVPTTSYESD